MQKGKILIIEDEKDLLKLVKYNCEKEGYHVISAGDGEAGLVLARKQKPDLIILDIMLPKMDGLKFCRTYRQESQTPIIFLTAKKNEFDRVVGLKLGADDYVTKPFSVEELLARVEAIFRRMQAIGNPEKDRKSIRIGDMEVDFERHEVQVKGKYSNLPPKEFEILKLLIQAKGRVLSRDQMLEKIWGYEQSSEMDTRTVDQHIARLRRRLMSEASRVVTVSNFGYQIKLNDAPKNEAAAKPTAKRVKKKAA